MRYDLLIQSAIIATAVTTGTGSHFPALRRDLGLRPEGRTAGDAT